MAPIGGEPLALGMERLAETGDIAMPEDRPAAGDERLAVLGHLPGEPADEGLGGGESDGLHAAFSPVFRAASQMRQRRR